ncbi:uncharacterized protein isoform X5 [Choristoneura fumiferana]|uniref:uncharacterized protein isoform X5 n=1 Tax=Choristoneura fumiferana TaxID=7141 RepID=UPI003D15CC3F
MDCCYVEEECEDYSVRPMLMVPCAPVKCRGEAPACFPCLPRCSKKVYCCEKPKSKPTVRSPAFSDEPDDDCCQPKKRSSRPRSSDDSYQSPQRQARCPPPPCYEPCCQPTCKPVKTKYVIPCYRYEDGRITNQPTVLMRRACEVAIGKRPRKKPFVESCYRADADHQESRYISEDEQVFYDNTTV